MADIKTIKLDVLITRRLYEEKDLPLVAKIWNKFIERLYNSKAISKPTEKKLHIFGKLIREETAHNIICIPGLSVFAGRLASNNTHTGNINYGVLGSGTGTFDGTETQLYTEVYRNPVASFTSLNNIAYISFYYNQTEVTGSFTEFGNVIDGSGSANSGQLWSHISIAWAKTNTQTLTVDCKYTIISD